MAVTIISTKCPDCGANLPVEEGREKLFCSYCGSQIIITNENEHVYRHVDEAKIKATEANQAIELKKLEIIQQKRLSYEKRKNTKILISIIMGILGVILMLIGELSTMLVSIIILGSILVMWMLSDNDDDLDFENKIKIPSGVTDYENKNYISIETMFKSAGFTNIKCIPLQDLRTGLLKKPNSVENITINGKEIILARRKFPPDATIIISYHSFPKR